jgi:hypothetical protein
VNEPKAISPLPSPREPDEPRGRRLFLAMMELRGGVVPSPAALNRARVNRIPSACSAPSLWAACRLHRTAGLCAPAAQLLLDTWRAGVERLSVDRAASSGLQLNAPALSVNRCLL